MTVNSHIKIFVLLFVACTIGSLGIPLVCDAGQRGLPTREGVPNFGKVSDGLFRGAQPDASAITNLHRLGIKSIINLRMPKESWEPEETIARSQGIQYTNFPMHGFGGPTDQEIRAVLSLIQSLPAPVFVTATPGPLISPAASESTSQTRVSAPFWALRANGLESAMPIRISAPLSRLKLLATNPG